jgi:hypothetical protein
MRHTNNNRRSNPNGRHPQQQQHAGRYRRGNAQNRTNAIYDRDEMSDIVTPPQRRHATNQQTKFLDLAKNAKQQGDRVEMEYYMQHVEHYTRVLNLADAQDAARNQERHARHQPRISEDGQDEESEVVEVVSTEPLTPEEEAARQMRAEQHKARRRQRRPRRDYGDRAEQGEQAAESSLAAEDISAPVTTEERTPSSEQPRRQTRQYTRRSVPQQKDLLDESNSGASLRDVLPAPRLD